MSTATATHPARYSRALVPVLAAFLEGVPGPVLDPFAGTGEGLAVLADLLPAVEFVGIELEPEWAAITPDLVRVGNALDLPFGPGTFGAVVTSPTYGNRLADHHHAQDASERRTYTHNLGRRLHPDNSGVLHWGPLYREFHGRAWAEVARVLRPGGRLILNISDHIRTGRRAPVSAWHVAELGRLGFELVDLEHVPTPRFRNGANARARVEGEFVFMFALTGEGRR
jgi:SAM-dependent methyltransferase